MALVLYDYAASCNCYKVRLLLSLLNRPYERVPVDIFAGQTLTDDYVRMNAARTTPVLEVAPGRFLPESNAILFYLAQASQYLPDGSGLDEASVLRWLFYEQAEVVPAIGGLRFRLLTGRLTPEDPEARSRHKAAVTVLELLDQTLEAREFLAGDQLTIADIAVYGYTHRAEEAGIDLGAFRAVDRWLRLVETEPGFIDDLEPYGANATPGAGRSIYD
jgi:glutathione S-transferase